MWNSLTDRQTDRSEIQAQLPLMEPKGLAPGLHVLGSDFVAEYGQSRAVPSGIWKEAHPHTRRETCCVPVLTSEALVTPGSQEVPGHRPQLLRVSVEHLRLLCRSRFPTQSLPASLPATAVVSPSSGVFLMKPRPMGTYRVRAWVTWLPRCSVFQSSQR